MTDSEMSYNEVVSKIRTHANNNANIERIIRFMRDSGLDVMDCILALKDANILSTDQAKVAVFKSPVWADAIGDYKRFHDTLVEGIDRSGLAESDPPT